MCVCVCVCVCVSVCVIVCVFVFESLFHAIHPIFTSSKAWTSEAYQGVGNWKHWPDYVSGWSKKIEMNANEKDRREEGR